MALEARIVLVGNGFIDNAQLACKIGDGNLVSATYLSSTEISCPDPGAFADETSTVVEATVNGIDFSSGNVVLTHTRTPYILGIHPSRGPNDGGTPVFLSGAHFPNSEGLACSFGGLVVPARWLSGGLLQCESPPRPETDTVVVQVFTDEMIIMSEGLAFDFYGTKVLGIFPPLGHSDGGTLVSVSGEGFQTPGNFEVRFGLTRVTASFVSSSEIQCLTPGQVGAGEVETVVTADGIIVDTVSDIFFLYTTPISLDSIEPAWGVEEEETTVFLRGSGFANTSELACSFGRDGKRLAANFISPAVMSCIVPAGIANGEYEVEVTTNGQEFSRGGTTFSVERGPTILSLVPSSGPSWGGEAIHVTGFNFRHTPELRCLFGSTAVVARRESSTSLWCISPAGQAGEMVGFAVSFDGRLTSSGINKFAFWGPAAEQCMPGTSNSGNEGDETLEHHLVGKGFSPSKTPRECGSHDELTPVSSSEYTSGYVANLVDDPDTVLNSMVASILRVVPDHGFYGGNTTVLVTGTNFVDAENVRCVFGASTVPGRWISAASVACVSAPVENNKSVPFDIFVNGVPSISSSFFFNYEEHPTVSAMLPSMGSVQGGTVVSFRGKGFVFSSGLWARFGNIGVPVAFVGPEELRCTCPPSFAGETNVLVGNYDKTFNSDELKFIYTDAPAVDGLHPFRGSITGGLKVRVRGRSFVNSTNLACMFGEAGVVKGTFVSPMEIDCEAPAFDAPVPQELEVSVNGVDFTSDGNVFTYTGTSAVFSATPDSGSANGGTVVVVEGTNFIDSSDLSCHFGDSSVSGRWISSQVIQCVTPVGVANKTVPLSISFVEGQTKIGGADFYFFLQPSIQGLSPTHGSTYGGTKLSIFGEGFWFSGDLRVRLGRTDISATYVSPSELLCTTPASSSPGLSSLLVSSNGVDFFGTDDVGYHYVLPTRVVALSPSKGPQTGGTPITVSGNGFRLSSRLGCLFDEEFVAATYQSETQVQCVTPPATKDRAVIVAVANDVPGSAAEGKEYLYIGRPYISSMYPRSGPMSGGTSIRVNGFNFMDAQEVRCVFGSQAVSARRVSSTQIRCISPQASTIQEVAFAVEIEEVHHLSGPAFSYYAEPRLVGITPRAGSVEGGTTLDLFGEYFVFSTTLKASIGSIDVPVAYINSTMLRCTTAASSAQTVEVGLSVDGSQGMSQPTRPYTYHDNPRVEDVYPSRGVATGGTAVSVSGDGFQDLPTLGCMFGSSGGKTVLGEFVSAEELVCTTPAATDVGSVAVEVTINGVDFSGNGNRFTHHGSPFITSVSPIHGNMVLVYGGYFVDSEVLACRFGPSIETPGRWVSRTLVECATPASDVITELDGETLALALSFDGEDQTEAVLFEPERPANFSALSPIFGPSVGGTTVFLQGSGFVFGGDFRVRFGGVEVPVTFISDVLLTCVAPAGEAGLTEVVPIVGMYAFANSSMEFQYVHDIKVGTVTTFSGAVAGLETAVVRGTNFISTSHLECRFGGKNRVPAAFVSTSEVWCDVPLLIEHGRTSLEISLDGESYSAAGFIMVDKEEEPLLAIDPSSGPSGGGTLVVISGRTFSSTTGIECLFGNVTVPAIWLSAEAIQCESPAFVEADQVRVIAVLDGFEAGSGVFTCEHNPVVSAFPEEGEDAGGTLVTISGRGFDTNRQWHCWFGLEKMPAVVVDDEGMSLQCLSPPRVSSESSVLLSVGTGSSLPDVRSALPFEYISPAEVISLHPASGPMLGGTSVVVTLEHGFGSYHPPLHCGFGEVGSSVSTWLNETAVICVSPPSPYRGKVLVSLHSSSTSEAVLGGTAPYWYFYPPTVSFVYPTEVETSKTPFVVTITGGNFEGSGPVSCRIGETMVSALWVSGSVIDCPFVAIFPGEHAIEVSNNMADFVPAGVIRIALPSEGLVVSTGHVSPSRGSTEGGTIISVFGPGIEHLGYVRHCLVGDLVLNATGSSKNHVECATTAHDEGTLPVSVCDSFDRCAHNQGEFSFVDIPVLAWLVPNTGYVYEESAMKVEMSKGCRRDAEGAWCRLGDTTVRASSIREDSVLCTIPADEYGLFNASVSCNGLDFSVPLPFIHHPEVVVHDVFPVSVSSDGGSVVHVSGKGFQNTAFGGTERASLLCLFDDTPAPALWVSEALALCRSPPRAPGIVVLSVSTSTNHEVVAATNITYVATGQSNNSFVLSPAAGSMEGGTVVSITGRQRLVGPVLCLFGEEITPAESISSFEITCVTPAAVAPGRIEVHLIWADYKEAVGEYEYETYLQLNRVSPTVADVDGGTIVTVFLEQESGTIPNATGISCRIRDVSVPALVHPAGRSAECVAPAGPPGPATVAVWNGQHEISRGVSTLAYVPLPVVSKVRPTGGFRGQQTEVNVYGHNFISSQELACFFGGNRALHVEWLSPTQVQCTVPKAVHGVTHVAVSLDGVRFTSPSTFSSYVAHEDIVLEGLDPGVGYVEGGVVVTVTGNNFPSTGGLECLFGDRTSPATVLSPNSLECVSPKLSVGTVVVELQYADAGGRVHSGSMPLQFQVIPAGPTVQFVSPQSGPVEGGTTLVIAGAYFPNATQIICRLQGRANVVDIVAVWLSSTGVACLSPRWEHPERAVALHLLIDGGMARFDGNSSMSFDFRVSPLIEEIDPRLGPESGGTEIRLLGANFRNTGTIACLICKNSVDQCTTVSGKWLSARELRCITPRHEPGLTTIDVVYNDVGTTRSAVQFLFVPASHVSNIYPTGGSVEGGTEVLVSGTNLAFTGTATCRFGDISTKAAFNASGIVCKSPRFVTPQIVPLEVSVNGADFTADRHTFQAFSSNADGWFIAVQPSFGDTRGGAQVVVHAENAPVFEASMNGRYECVFGDEATPALVTSPSSVNCRSPSSLGARAVDLRLRSTDGNGETAATRFDVLPAVELLSLEPASGQSAGGDTVIVHGTGFVDTSLACCHFGDSSTPAVLLSATAARCVVPPRIDDSSSLVVVQVSHTCDEIYGMGLDFRYDDDVFGAWNASEDASLLSVMEDQEQPLHCALENGTSISPGHGDNLLLTCLSRVEARSIHHSLQVDDGISNGTTVSLSSGPVEGGSTVEISGVDEYEDGILCRFAKDGWVELASATPMQAGSATCVAPPGPASGTVLLQVTSNEGALILSTLFLYFSQPILYSFEPFRGAARGQAMLHIVTSGASAISNPKCGFFDASYVLLYTSDAAWTTSTDVWCQYPDAEPGRVFVEVSMNGINFTQGSGLEFTVNTKPGIFSISPLVGAATGGTQVTVHGTGFGHANAGVCRFGGTQVLATVVSDHVVVCVSPYFSGGPIKKSDSVDFSLILNAQEVQSSSIKTLFSYLANPVVSTVSPKTGPVAGGTSVYVNGENFVDTGSGVECLFGALQTRATVVSVNRVVCDSPPHAHGEVAIAVRNDGSSMMPSHAGPSFFYNSSLRISLSAPSRYANTQLDGNIFAISSNDSNLREWIITDYSECASGLEPSRQHSEGGGCSVTGSYVESIRPDSGQRVGGTTVIVTGTYFAANGGFACHFGKRQTDGYVVDITHMVCSAPPSSVRQAVEFYVSSDGQPLQSDGIVYVYEDTPVVVQVRPHLVYQGGGNTDVVVIGEGFRNTSSLACLLGDEILVRGKFLSDTSAMCFVPQNVGHVRLELSNNGVDFSSSGNGVTFTPRPLVTGVDRSATSHSGGTDIIVWGLYFINVPELACVVGGQKVPARWISTEHVRCGLPSSHMPGLVEVAVTLNRQEFDQNVVSFKYSLPPSMLAASVRPSFGACDGGTVVVIEGSNLRGRGGIVCRFGTAHDVVAQVLDDSTVRCVTPGGKAGETRIKLGTSGDSFSATSAIFTYVMRPTIARLQPSGGTVHGGTRVAVLGSEFANTTKLDCHFGTERALTVAFVSAGEVICEAPPSVAPAVVPVTVGVNGVASASSASYRYVLGATVIDVSPHNIIFNESRWLTVTGVNFISGPELVCLFNETITTTAQWVSSNLVRCPVPITLRPGNQPILVNVKNNGQDVSTSSASILVRPRLTIHSILPARGPLDQSTPVVVVLRAYSRHVQHDTQQQTLCLFDDEPVRAVSAIAPVHHCHVKADEPSLACVTVRCTAPGQQAARNASLRIVDGTGAPLTNTAVFAFGALPTVHSISPRFGTFGGGTAITIDYRPAELYTLPETAGCRFSDAYDTVYVVGEVSTGEPGSLSVVCSSPPWRNHSGRQSLVKLELVLDGFLGAIENHYYFVYSHRAKILAVTPRWTTDKGGREVRVRGIGFGPHSRFSCFFADQTTPRGATTTDHIPSTPAVKLSDEELLCESPVRPPGPAYVTVIADGEQIEGKVQILVTASANVKSLSPLQGPASGGTIVDLSGDNFFFTGLAACRFGSYKVPAQYVTPLSLLCVSPRSHPGTYPVSVAIDGEHFEDSGLTFQYVEEMRIMSLSPTFGWTTGGTNVTVRVAGLQSHGRDASFLCVFGSRREAAISIDVNDGSVVCSSPTPAQTSLGKVVDDMLATTVSVVESSGAVAATSAELFQYVLPVTVTAVVPDRGPTDTAVQVLGENFVAGFGLKCLFGDLKTPATFVTSQRVDCRAPANQTGQVGVSVLAGGTLPAWHTRAFFSFEQPIALLSLQPSSGRHGESTAVTVMGSGFQPSASLLCRFGELKTPATVMNSTHVRCLAPPEGRGEVRVSLSARGEQAPWTPLFFFYETEVRIRHLVPSEGSIFGGTLLTMRMDIDLPEPDLRCIFSSSNAVSTSSAAKASENTVQCRTPPSPGLKVGTAWMSLTMGETAISEGASFSFLNPPVVRSIHPQRGYKQGGERLVVSGENFVPSNKLACKFASAPTHEPAFAPAQFISNTQVSCVTPVWETALSAVIHVTVDVTTNGVDYTSEGPGFVVQPVAKISAVSPSAGLSTGGTPVTISDAALPRENLSCVFGTSTVSAWVTTDFQAVCISPKMPQGYEGRVPLHLAVDGRVVSATGAAFTYVMAQPRTDSILSTVVYNDDGKMAQPWMDGYGRLDPDQVMAGIPSVSRLEPNRCSSSGNVDILIRGSNFKSSPSLTCSFGGVYRNATFLSDVAARCVSPRHTPADVLLEVSNDGEAFSASGVQFHFHSDPSILSIDPPRGSLEGSTLVTVIGSQFRHTSNLTCRFGDTAVPGLFVSSNQIECWTPPLEKTGIAVEVKVRLLEHPLSKSTLRTLFFTRSLGIA